MSHSSSHRNNSKQQQSRRHSRSSSTSSPCPPRSSSVPLQVPRRALNNLSHHSPNNNNSSSSSSSCSSASSCDSGGEDSLPDIRRQESVLVAVGWKGDVSSPHSSAATTPSAACLPDADSPPQPQERLRDLAGPGYDAEALAAFYTEVLVPSFPDKNDRDPLCDMEEALSRDHQFAHTSRMHVVLYEYWSPEEKRWRVGGGTEFEYYPPSQTALLGYIAVSKDMRGRGVGKTLINESIRVVRERYGEENLRGFFAETLADSAEDGDFPTSARQRFFHGLGFRQVAMPYITPILQGCEIPSFHYTVIVHMDTIPSPGEVSATVVHEMLVDYWNANSGEDVKAMESQQATDLTLQQRLELALHCPYFSRIHRDFFRADDEEGLRADQDHSLPLLDLPWKEFPMPQ